MELLGRRPTQLELLLFEKAISDLLEHEYSSKPPELRQED